MVISHSRALLLINREALLLIDGGALLVVPLSALPLRHRGTLLLALRLQKAHGWVGGGPRLDQGAQLVRGGEGQDSHR